MCQHRKLGLLQALVALAWNQESVILSDSAKKLYASFISKSQGTGSCYYKRKSNANGGTLIT